jgi:hypothetical protein
MAMEECPWESRTCTRHRGDLSGQAGSLGFALWIEPHPSTFPLRIPGVGDIVQ